MLLISIFTCKTRNNFFSPSLRYLVALILPKKMKASNCNVVHIVTTISSRNQTCPLVLLEDISDQSIPLLSMKTWQISVLIAILIGCVVINTLGKIFTIYYIKERAPKRPLNDMIFIDQCLQLPPSVLHGILVTFCAAMKKPLVSTFGHYTCIWMSINVAFHNTVLVIDGAGMAFYRLFSYKMAGEISIENLQIIKRLILWYGFMIGTLIFGLALFGIYLTNSTSTLDFCQGYNREMSYILSTYQKSGNFHVGKTALNLSLIIGQFVIIFEFICYVTIMVSLFMHDKKMAKDKVIDKKVMKQRTKKSAITLTGQFLSFVLEIGYTILVLTPINDLIGWKVFEYGNRSILVIFCWTAITLVQIGTSPELRRFLNGAKVDVAPNSMNLTQLLQALKLENRKSSNDIEMSSEELNQ